MENKIFIPVQVILLLLIAFLKADGQTVCTYNFGTGTASYITAGSTNQLPAPQSGNAYVYLSNTPNGGVHVKNPGLTSFGSDSKLMIHGSSTGGSCNKFSISGYSGSTSSYVKFTIIIADSSGAGNVNGGTFYFCTGNGSSFTNNGGISSSEAVTGLRWIVSGIGTVSTDAIKTGNSWSAITINPFYQGQSNAYTVEVFGNNSSSATSYFYNGVSQSIASMKQDIYINGLLCADDADISGNGLPVNTAVNSFMFFTDDNNSNNLCIFLDDIYFATSIAPSYQSYAEYYAKPTGNLELTSNWTTNIDGSGTQYPPDFAGDAVNGGGKVAMNFNLRNRPAATIGGTWNVTGENCKFKIGDGTNPVTFTIPSSYSFASTAVEINPNGTLSNQNAASSSFGTFTIYNNGKYQHSCNGGTIPAGTWSPGSICEITGITNTAPAGSGQAFGSFIWNCASQSASVNLGGLTGFSAAGDFTVQSTGGVSGRTIQLTSSNNFSAIFSGNLQLSGGNLALSSGSGTSSLNIIGNLTLTNPSELYFSQDGSANSTIYLNGNLSVGNGAAITETGSATGNLIYFENTGTQSITNNGAILNDINYTIGPGAVVTLNSNIDLATGRNFTVQGTLHCGTNTITGNGNFVLQSGGALGIGSIDGIAPAGNYGNVQVSGTRNYSIAANYIYNGGAPQNGGQGLPTTVNNLVIDNANGVQLMTNTVVNGVMLFSNGILDIGNYSITINPGAFLTGYSPTKYVKTSGTGSLTREVGNSDVFYPVGNGSYTPVTLNNSGTLDNFSVNIKNTFDNPPASTKVVKKQFNISEGIYGGSSVTMSLQWNRADEDTSFNRQSPIEIGHWTDGHWVNTYASSGVSGNGPYTVTASGFTSFSPYIIGNQSTLPVELSFFRGSVTGRNIILKWSTSSELNNSGFYVERSIAGKSDWTTSGFVKGRGNTGNQSDYTYEDRGLNPSEYKYRLKQTDYNGNFTYYDLQGSITLSMPASIKISDNYPNPFNPETKFDIELPAPGKIGVSVYDVSGRLIKGYPEEARDAGYGSVVLKMSGYSSGIYFCRININSGSDSRSYVKKIVMMK
ncbi:MAG: T9SS type A sorting domain-containing protein [Bacteroidetes bacterium]|nr:T9SS type A sorting domain-containing protein [Bacteroidota bacterium]